MFNFSRDLNFPKLFLEAPIFSTSLRRTFYGILGITQQSVPDFDLVLSRFFKWPNQHVRLGSRADQECFNPSCIRWVKASVNQLYVPPSRGPIYKLRNCGLWMKLTRGGRYNSIPIWQPLINENSNKLTISNPPSSTHFN